jgi:hypothetical protein
MAQLKNTIIDSTGDLSLPSGTTGQRPGQAGQPAAAAGMIRYNTTLNETEYYDGTAWRPISDTGVEATGGTIVDTEIGGVPYRIHLFTNTGNSTFTVTKSGEVEYLIVAGGGGAGADNAGGGGGGGVLTGSTLLSATSYSIVVGAGGNPSGTSNTNQQTNGINSSAFGLTAIGGGQGANGQGGSRNPFVGGSGGGGDGEVGRSGAAGTPGQGFAGGNGGGGSGGGGGGAGGPGENGTSSKGGNGGNGILLYIDGTSRSYGSGGGAGGNNATLGGTAGSYSGGGIGNGSSSGAGVSAAANTGGGAGASCNTGNTSGAGGSGIVVIRYRRNASTTTSPTRTVVASVPNNFNIVQTNLVWYVNAANPVSYSGTGSTWQNIGPTGFNGTLRNSPTFSQQDGGYFILGSNKDVTTGTTPPSLQGNPNLTVSGWFKRKVTDWGGFRGTWGIGGNTTNQGINSWWNNNNNQLSIDVWSSGTFFASGVDYPLNQWVFMTWQKIAGSMTRANCILWRNLDSYTGTQLTISRAETGVPAINNIGITLANISPTHTQLAANSMEIGEFFIYDRVLTAEEVRYNFNITRGRYGV